MSCLQSGCLFHDNLHQLLTDRLQRLHASMQACGNKLLAVADSSAHHTAQAATEPLNLMLRLDG